MPELRELKVGDIVGHVPIEPPLDVTPVPGCRWYVLETETGREMTATANLALRRVPFYVPMMLVVGRLSRGDLGKGITRPDVAKPLFPGLIFIAENVAASKDRLIRSCYGVSSRPYMRFGPDLAILDPDNMAIVQGIEQLERERYLNAKADAKAEADRPKYVPTVGDKVRFAIKELLGDRNGTITDIDAQGRITLLVQIMKRKVRVTVTSDQIVPV